MFSKKEKLTINNTIDEICVKILEALKTPADWTREGLVYSHINGIIAAVK